MEKLLNERLREWGSDAFAVYNARSYYGEDDGRVNSMGRVFKKMADEIERCYIPRPRFEDGEPVQERAECEHGTVDLIQVEPNGDWELLDDRGLVIESGSVGVAVKRPAPKALDADRVGTKVGDTVYLIDHDDEDLSEYHGALQVMEIRIIGCSADPFFVVANEEGTATVLGHGLFTHRKPDSLEKLRDDIAGKAQSLNAPSVGEMEVWTDRLTALIERGA